MKNFKNKFITLSSSNKKLSYSGLVLDHNDDLSLLRNISGDYILDGFIVLLNKHLREYFIDEKERFAEKIVKLKLNKNPKIPLPKITLSTFDETITAISKKYGIFQINPIDPTICYLGTLSDIDEKTITIEDLTPEAKWNGKMTFQKSKIRSIEFGTDYVESLKLLAKPIYKK